MARPKVKKLDCGHYSETDSCQICGEREAIEAIRKRAEDQARSAASRPVGADPTHAPAGVLPDAAGATTGAIEPAIPAPGIYDDLDEATYHRGIVAGEPSLSHSGMKTLLAQTPHRFRWELEQGEVSTAAFELGSAAHTLVLGVGPKPVDVGEDAWRGAKKLEVEAVRRDGCIPLKTKDYQRVIGMAMAVSRHRGAARLLTDGRPEVSIFARDPDTQVMMRARLDWLRDDGQIVDFKTSLDARPSRFGRRALDYGYYLQDPTYRHIAEWAGIEVTGFEFVQVEVEPPYEVSICHLQAPTRDLGWLHAREAIDLFNTCMTAGEWPSHPDESVGVDVPGWALRDLDFTREADQDETSPVGFDIFDYLDQREAERTNQS